MAWIPKTWKGLPCVLYSRYLIYFENAYFIFRSFDVPSWKLYDFGELLDFPSPRPQLTEGGESEVFWSRVAQSSRQACQTVLGFQSLGRRGRGRCRVGWYSSYAAGWSSTPYFAPGAWWKLDYENFGFSLGLLELLLSVPPLSLFYVPLYLSCWRTSGKSLHFG